MNTTPALLLLVAFAQALTLSACSRSPDAQLVPPGTMSAADLTVPPGSATPPAQSGGSLKEQIAQLEKSGKTVALDRSDSLLGPDLNNNGVRDDIEAYIQTLQLTPSQLKAAMQRARSMQKSLAVDTNNKAEVQKVGELSMASSNCLFDEVTEGNKASEISNAIESKTANTKIRVMKYLAYNSASSGSVTRLPSGDTCEK